MQLNLVPKGELILKLPILYDPQKICRYPIEGFDPPVRKRCLRGLFECSIYQIEKGQQVVFPNVNGSRFNFGYLRVNKDTPPTESQVFIDFLTKDKKEVKKMEIYLNSKGQIIVRYDGIKMAESTENLKNLSKLPSWYFFEVILQDGEIKIKRPGDATNIIKGKLPDIVTDNFEVSISSKCMEYVTFNCLTQCKTFDHLKGKTMIIKLQNSFTINLLCSKYKSTCFIKYAISSSWFQSFNHTNNLSPGMEIALQFKISVEDGVKK
ncbi:Monocarboxylate transporter 7 [Armadillidium vulgare]|nr:Monocarboxylate transporter 7 [Armadillidium vulgare]